MRTSTPAPDVLIPSTETLSLMLYPRAEQFLIENQKRLFNSTSLCAWSIAKALEDIYLFSVSMSQEYHWYYSDFYEQNKDWLIGLVSNIMPIGIFANRPYSDISINGGFGNFYLRIE